MISQFTPLSKICSNISRKFSPPKNNKVWFINTGDVLNGKFLHNDISDWSSLPGQAKKAIEENDILYSEIRPGNGRFAFVGREHTNAVVSTKFMVIKSSKGVYPRYLYHYLTSPRLQGKLKSIADSRSGTFPQITFDSISHLEIRLPEMEEQKSISNFLDYLQSRLETNEKTNETLEKIAKALFKSWFIDFDPVKAKSEGRSTALPDEFSDLFPDSFEDSELGKIPKGWSTNSIYKISKVLYGAPFSSKLFNTQGKGIPLARIRDLKTGNPGVWTEEIHPKGCLIEPGDIVVGMDAEFRTYLWGNQRCWMNQRICKFIPNEKFNNCFLRYSISKPLYMMEISETATTVIHLGKSDIDAFRIIYPSSEILDLFGKISKPIEQSIIRNKQESTTLNLLKNILIPKLISGELIIPDAEKMIEELGI